MRTITSVLATLTLALILAGPATAQDEATVTLTFQITVNGTLHPDESLDVRYVIGQGRGYTLLFCGPAGENFPDAERCVGEGAVYSVEGEAPEGVTVQFRLSRQNDNVRPAVIETFVRGSETFLSDTTISAYYNFDTEQGGLGQDPSVPNVPDTGAGGMGSSRLPISAAVTTFTLLLTALATTTSRGLLNRRR